MAAWDVLGRCDSLVRDAPAGQCWRQFGGGGGLSGAREQSERAAVPALRIVSADSRTEVLLLSNTLPHTSGARLYVRRAEERAAVKEEHLYSLPEPQMLKRRLDEAKRKQNPSRTCSQHI